MPQLLQLPYIILKLLILKLVSKHLASANTISPTGAACSTRSEWLGIYGNTSPLNFRFGQKWNNGIVIYHLNSSLTEDDTKMVMEAIYEFQSKTCIQFKRKGDKDHDYVSIERDDRVCGEAHVCKMGGYQYAKFGDISPECRTVATMTHELGHSLCLLHEHQRFDRDNYLKFANDGCRYDRSVEKRGELKGLYDYSSTMHYNCDSCMQSKSEFVDKCGGGNEGVTWGLSILDADYINELYDCRACFRHRWVPKENVTYPKDSRRFSFGSYDWNTHALYPCRGFVEGSILVGKQALGICYLPHEKEERSIYNFEVLTIPNGLQTPDSAYRLIKVNSSWSKTKLEKIFAKAVVGGHLKGADGSGVGNIYIGYVQINITEKCSTRYLYRMQRDTRFNHTKGTATVIGSVVKYEDRYKTAFSLCGIFNADVYYVLVCDLPESSLFSEQHNESEEESDDINDSTGYPNLKSMDSLTTLYERVSQLVVFGTVANNGTYFEVDLLDSESGENVIVRFQARVEEQDVVRNSFIKGFGWGMLERGMGSEVFPFKRGDKFKILIKCRQNSFRFYVNNRFFFKFLYRQALGNAKYIRVAGDLTDVVIIPQ